MIDRVVAHMTLWRRDIKTRTRRRAGQHGHEPRAGLPQDSGFEIAGLCSRGVKKMALPPDFTSAPTFTSFDEALAQTRPDVVSINTFPDTHAEFAIKAMESGAHVFVEKPLAETVAEAERVVQTAVRTGRKLVDRLHPAAPSIVAAVRRAGAHPGNAAGLSHEPEPAVERRAVGNPQEPAEEPLADRRLRRPLRRHLVPDHTGQPAHRACGRRPPHQRHPRRHVQLRPPAGDVRRWIGGVVRGGLGTDDE